MNPRVLVDGVERDVVSAQDRGLSYGDGVFETMLVAAGRLPWWQAHLARLQRGCARLRIDMPDAGVLAAEARELCRDQTRAVLKLIVTRGAAGRGYSIASATRSTRILSLHPAPILDPADYAAGVAVHECKTRLAIQPSLAGIKHLNRLEQVLARSEWDDPAVVEGLVQDTDGRIVSATAANVFIASRGRWFTPDFGRCGIEGVCRAWVMARFAVEVADIPRARLLESDELFLSSSLRGILPVARFGGRHWDVGPMTRVVQQALWQELPALDPQRASDA